MSRGVSEGTKTGEMSEKVRAQGRGPDSRGGRTNGAGETRDALADTDTDAASARALTDSTALPVASSELIALRDQCQRAVASPDNDD